MDAAVEDGVDVLSLSLGGPSIPFYGDVIAVGAFGATQKGIFVSCAAGNSGPYHGSLSNEAPWILTVGASTTDRILNLTSTPTSTILFNGAASDPLAPKVATFSSRGPNTASPGILKPDIIGPGVDILAAWPVSVDNATKSNATFNIISGTSMSTPHLSGIAALLKSSHPDWSPAAIKSAIMTSANDYIPYLCGLNYTEKEIQIITQQKVNCSQVGVIPEAQLNYPSFSIKIGSNESQSQYYTRTVRNVGPASSTYNLDLLVPHKMGMSVNPEVLTFTEVNQEITYHVEFIAEDGAGKDGVCSEKGCAEGDILAALDTAVEDGVDVLSLSLGGASVPFYADGIAIGAFGAIQKGIFVSCSAGNSGPFYASLANEAPWILTVGASTIDRSIKATALLGNGAEYDGESLFQPKDFSSKLLPLVYAGANGKQSSAFCDAGSLGNVEGAIVLCERGGGVARIDKGAEVKRAGGAAMILVNAETDGDSTLADPHVLPATHVGYVAGVKIKAYLNSTSSPAATILFKGTVIGDRLAPKITSFSSRGPSIASTGILKPDIIGPGVSILAAWPVSVDNGTEGKATFNMVSGTSMSCPHLSGIAALLKSSHPDWSPAAIKSAIMTTAEVHNLEGKPIVDETLKPADIFATGAGHVNPSKANDPGLIYDTKPEDYIPYLCGLNYTDEQIQVITQQRVNCSEVEAIREAQLNYPSFSIIVGSSEDSKSQYYTRTVKNVGPANSTYNLDLFVPQNMGMSVNPQVLKFTEVNQEITFEAEFFAQDSAGKDGVPFAQGYLRWVSDQHSVTSPISVIFASK
ncbi:hypothetical protein ACE6H2_017100 [Prunus campanulata]